MAALCARRTHTLRVAHDRRTHARRLPRIAATSCLDRRRQTGSTRSTTQRSTQMTLHRQRTGPIQPSQHQASNNAAAPRRMQMSRSWIRSRRVFAKQLLRRRRSEQQRSLLRRVANRVRAERKGHRCRRRRLRHARNRPADLLRGRGALDHVSETGVSKLSFSPSFSPRRSKPIRSKPWPPQSRP